MNTNAVPASIVSLIAAYNGGAVTDKHLQRFLANPNMVFGCDQEITLIDQVSKDQQILPSKTDLPAVVCAGNQAIYWTRGKGASDSDMSFLVLDKECVLCQGKLETAEILGVCGDEPVIKYTKYTAAGKMESGRIEMGDRSYGPFKKILFNAIDEVILVLIVEDFESDGLRIHDITNVSHRIHRVPAYIIEALGKGAVTHCGMHRYHGVAGAFHFIVRGDVQELVWVNPGKEHWRFQAKEFYGVYADPLGQPVFCERNLQNPDAYFIFTMNERFLIDGPPVNGKFRVTNHRPSRWQKITDHRFGFRIGDETLETTEFPDVDLCDAELGPLYSFRDKEGVQVRRMKKDQGTLVGTHRKIGPLQFDRIMDWPLYPATDDGKNWYVRWGDYRSPLFDEIYSVQKAGFDIIEYVVRKRRKLYRVRVRHQDSAAI